MSLHLAATSESDRALQRGLERHVFTLLRRARRPLALQSLPLMKWVCRETGVSNPVAALERIVRSALGDDDETNAALRQAIFDADFDRVASNGELARRRGISRRHFQRLRSKAVAKIASRVRPIAETSLSGSFGDDRARPGNGWRYDREEAAYRRAQAAGNALEMRSIACNMARLAQTKEGRMAACERRADADLRLGRREDALNALDRLTPTAQRLVRAKLAFLEGDLAGAQAHAGAAGAAMRGTDRDRYAYLAFVAQVRFERSRAWAPPETWRLAAASWERAVTEAEHARHLWRSDPVRAESMARAAYRRAAEQGYDAVAARCAALLTTAAQRRGEREESHRLRAEAIEYLLRTQDRLAAAALFLNGAYEPGTADPALVDGICRRMAVVSLQAAQPDEVRRAAVRTLIPAILDAAIANRPEHAVIDERICPAKHFEAVREVLALAIAALAHIPFAAAYQRIRANESQRTPTEHLRVDDDRSGPRTRSVESLADLRVRVVPV